MDLSFSKEELAFRDEVRGFIADNLPEDIRDKMRLGLPPEKEDTIRWQRILNQQELIAVLAGDDAAAALIPVIDEILIRVSLRDVAIDFDLTSRIDRQALATTLGPCPPGTR